MSSSTERVLFDSLALAVDENVYNPAEDTFLFAENLSVEKGEVVLDVGTGCGILGILAAKKAKWVIATDVNPHAVRCAHKNAILNGVQTRMSFLQGDLFAPFCGTAKFDAVLFNAPYLPSVEAAPLSWVERSWDGGESGRIIIDRFIGDVKVHVQKTGRVMLMQSTFAGANETIQEFTRLGMKAKIIAELAMPFFERLYLVEARVL